MRLDRVDRKLVNVMQSGFPLVAEPFRELAGKLDISQDETIERVRALKGQGIVRRIGGVFDSSKLGYHSTLGAMHLAGPRLDEAAAVVSQHPGVSHNYARDHYYNLWFTLSLPHDRSLADAIAALSAQAGAEATINLPAVAVFKIGVFFDLLGDDGQEPAWDQKPIPVASTQRALSELERSIVRELQGDLPVAEGPFGEMAGRLGLAVGDLLAKVQSFEVEGIMRRYGASLRHRLAGFVANAMACWTVASDVQRAGHRAASYRQVSHCYQRQTASGWPYNLFAMIHGRDREECESVTEDISIDIGNHDHVLLFSGKEYKKEPVQYFTEAG